MAAKYMITPVGPVAIREDVAKKMAAMSDREVANAALNNGTPFIDPEHYAELLDRKLTGPGMSAVDTFRMIERREQARRVYLYQLLKDINDGKVHVEKGDEAEFDKFVERICEEAAKLLKRVN